MKVIIKDDYKDEAIEIDVRQNYTGKKYEKGSLLCRVTPWDSQDCPLTLDIAITPSGEILFRGWDWRGNGNAYLHTYSEPSEVEVTEDMINTVSGLFSGRIKYEGIKIPVGATVQAICPIDVAEEEALLGKKIYLA